MLHSLTIVLANVLPGFQSSVSSSNFDLMFFSRFEFFTLSRSCEIQTTLIPRSPTFPALPPTPFTRSHSARPRHRACSPTLPSNPGAWVAASRLCSFLSHPRHPRACLPAFCHFVTQSLVSGPEASASVRSLLEMHNLSPHPRPTGSEYALSQGLQVIWVHIQV